jgi:hypothetical protein
VVLEVDVVTSLKEDLGLVRVYPNPGEGDLMIRYQSGGGEMIEFELSDMNGRSLKRVMESPNTTGEYRLSIGELRLGGGMYLLQVRQGGASRTVKVVRK